MKDLALDRADFATLASAHLLGTHYTAHAGPSANVQSAPRATPLIDANARQTRAHRWRAPGTCGELLQGAIGGRDFMVNCPIDLYATAHATATERPGLHVEDASAHGKVLATLHLLHRRVLRSSNRIDGVGLTMQSPIPRSKGMASSTADASAALAAFSACHGISLNEREVARLLTSVEPSDCTHYPGIAQVDFFNGDLIERLPVPAGLKVLVVDCGGEVETLTLDRARARAVYARHEDRLAAALRLLKKGLRSGCNHSVARAATESTDLSQLILPKAMLPELRRLRAELGVLGFNCAHSGTVLGLLYTDAPGRDDVLRDRVQRTFGADLPVVGSFNVIGGGTHEI